MVSKYKCIKNNAVYPKCKRKIAFCSLVSRTRLPVNADDFRMDQGVTASPADSDAAKNLAPNLKSQPITVGHLYLSTAEVKQLEWEGSKNN